MYHSFCLNRILIIISFFSAPSFIALQHCDLARFIHHLCLLIYLLKISFRGFFIINTICLSLMGIYFECWLIKYIYIIMFLLQLKNWTSDNFKTIFLLQFLTYFPLHTYRLRYAHYALFIFNLVLLKEISMTNKKKTLLLLIRLHNQSAIRLVNYL